MHLIITDNFKNPEQNRYEAIARNILALHDGDYGRVIKLQEEMIAAMHAVSSNDYTRTLRDSYRVLAILKIWRDEHRADRFVDDGSLKVVDDE